MVPDGFNFRELAPSTAYGEALRRTMEGLNALASCPGFDPAVNPAFWNRQLATILLSESEARFRAPDANADFDLATTRFVDKDMFGRYSIQLDFSSYPNPTAAACALEICAGVAAGSRGMGIRNAVLTSLADFLVEPPGYIDVCVAVNLFVHEGLGDAPDDTSWAELAQMLSELKDLWMLDGEAATRRLNVALGREMNPISFDKSFREGVDLLCSPDTVMTLRELHILLDDSVLDDERRHLSRLMQWLARQDSLRSLSWQFREKHWSVYSERDALSSVLHGCREKFMSTVYSALPHMKALTSWKGVLEASQWMLYALLRRQQRGLTISLEVEIVPPTSQMRRDIIPQPNCLEGVIPEIILLRMNAEVLPIGTTVVIPEGTNLAASPFLDGLDIRVVQAWLLGVVARCTGRLLVVFPGVGFWWMDDGAGITRRVRAVVDVNLNPFGLLALTCLKGEFSEVSALLEWAGSYLPELYIMCHNKSISPSDFEMILRLCPQLKVLHFVDVDIASVVPLLNAYARGECHISSLLYFQKEGFPRPVVTEGLLEVLAAACDPEHVAATRLEELLLAPQNRFLPVDRLEDYVRRLASNRRLRVLCVSAWLHSPVQLVSRHTKMYPPGVPRDPVYTTPMHPGEALLYPREAPCTSVWQVCTISSQ